MVICANNPAKFAISIDFRALKTTKTGNQLTFAV